jgi:hypothetical protein
MSGETQFELTAQDNVDALRTHTGRLSGKLAWALLAVALMFPLIDLWAGIPILEDTAFLVCLGLALFFLAWDHAARDWMVRRQFRQSQGMRSQLRFRWDDQALWIDTDRSQARYDWSQFYRWKRSRTSLLLYRDAGFFIFIPRRAVSDDAFDDMAAALKAAGVKDR